MLWLAALAACASSTHAPYARAPRSRAPSAWGEKLPSYPSPARQTNVTHATNEPSSAEPASASTQTLLGLRQVIAATVLNDPRIRAAFAEVLRARADLLTESAFDNPNLTLSQTLLPFPGKGFTPRRQGGPPQLDLTVDYSLERLLFGERAAAMRAADHTLEAELASYADVARERVFEAISAFVDVLEARELAQLSRDQVVQLDRLETITARRVALGSVGQVELSRVHIAVLSGRRRALMADVELKNAESRLRARLGAPYVGRAIALDATLELEPHKPPALATLLERAYALRPDLLAQERRLEAARAAEQRERRRGLPDLNVGLVYSRQFQERALDMPDANAWGAVLRGTLPAFNRNQGGIATAQASLFEAEATRTALRIELRAELEQALRSLEAAEQILATFDAEAMRAAESARNTIEEAYALGGRSLLELLDAQQVYREAYREHVVARAEYMRAVQRLNALVGEEVLR